MRRNLLIAQTLSSAPLNANVLMIAGACQISKFELPPGVDFLSLPSLCKAGNGQYGSRNLDLTLSELTELRSRTINAALNSFSPDVLVVDNVPRGAVRELDATLEALRGRTKLVLGLRDILDASEDVRREWERADNLNAIRDYYDVVWVYGDPSVYNLVSEYGFPADIATRVRFTGYLDQRPRLQTRGGSGAPLGLPAGPLTVCAVGGGQDGVALAEAFVHADLPLEQNAVLVTGPFMPDKARRKLNEHAATRERLHVHEFITEPMRLLIRADRLVAMGGYNTTCELLSLNIPTLMVPRVTPRTEQLLRAQRFSQLGYLDLLHPDQLSPRAISEWLGREPVMRRRQEVDLDGLRRLPLLVEELLAAGDLAFPEGGVRHADRW
jgi:predicted glycosyltransferase